MHIFGRSLSTQLNCNSKNGSDVVNFLSTQWSTDGSTSSEYMELCITSIVKTLTDNHTLDDRNNQGHHTTLLLSEILLSTAQASLCVVEVRSLESTGSPCGEFWSQISISILTGYKLNKSLHLATWGSEWSYASGFATRLTLCQTFLTMSCFRTATAAFPRPTDQPQVWPAVVAAFTGLEPLRFLYVGIP